MALRMKHHLGQASSSLRYEPTPMRIRAYAGGSAAVDTSAAYLIWEPRRIVPVFAVPREHILVDVLEPDPQPEPPDLSAVPPILPPGNFGTHTCPGTVLDVAGVAGAGFAPDDPDLEGRVLLDFGAFDRWQAEDDELVGHAHDPFKRIEVLNSSKRVEVSLGDTPLASSSRARMLLETHLPVRWYFPPDDVRMDMLTESDHRSTCAYKGHASYFSLLDGSEAGRDIGWVYRSPRHDAEQVRDYICFWAERTDLAVDGVPQTRPVTPWSRPEEQANADPERLEFG